MRYTRTALAALVLAATSTRLSAQNANEVELTKIDAAVARYLRRDLPAKAAFETRIKVNNQWVESRSTARLSALATLLHAAPVHHDTIFVCPGDPSTCTLRHVGALLSLSDPTVLGNSATIRVSRLDLSGYKRIPVSRRDFELHLNRNASGWHVESERVLSVT